MALAASCIAPFASAQEIIENEDEQAEEPAPAPPPPPSPTPKPAPVAERPPFADEPSEAPKPLPAKPKPPVGIRVDAGYATRRLFTIPVSGVDMGLGVGVQPKPFAAVWGATRVFYGNTEYGLNVFSVRLGGEGELVMFDRVRVGAGLSAFIVGVGRYVRNETLLSWGPEARLTARVDLLQPTGFAIFARGALEGAYEIYDDSAFWGMTAGIGVDFDVAGKRVR